MRRILTIIAVTLIGVFCISTVTLAIAKTNFNELPVNEAAAIEVYYNNKHSGLIEKDDSNETKSDVFNKVMDYYNEGTSQSILTSLFQNLYSESAKPTVEKVNWSWSSSKSANTMFIIFRFSPDNAPYIEVNDYKENEAKVQFDTLWLEVSESAEMSKVSVYVRKKSESTSSVATHKIDFLLETSSLYSYILELDETGLLF